MVKPPTVQDPDPNAAVFTAEVLRTLAAFGRDLAGVLRPETVVKHLAQTFASSFAPTASAIALFDNDANRLRVLQVEPEGTGWADPVLDAALRRGALHLPGTHPARGVGIDLSPEAPPCWIAAPIVARRVPIGAIALGGPRETYTAPDLARLEVYAAMAALALESAFIVDQADDTRRSWAETLDAIGLPLCIVERSGRVRRANRAFAGLIHASFTAVAGRPWLALVPPAWGEGIEAALAAAGTGREFDLQAGDLTLAVSAFPMGEDDSSCALIFHDRTERRHLQAQLIQSEKMSAVGQLVAGVAHDLNNPLASVLGFADFLAESPEVPSALREPVRIIQQESLRAANIVRNLLSFARKREHRLSSVDVGPLLEATLGLLRNQIMADHMEARLEVESGLPDIRADSHQVQQVFVNLINNASQASALLGHPGEIRIRARRWMDGVAIDVIDDGPGMTEEVAARVFEPFFTTKPEGQGTGLGLTICQGIVKEHGGRITLFTRPNQGATFTVELPGSAAMEPPPADGEPATPAASALSVLIVEDEPHIVHYLRTTLEAWGHQVASAADGIAALELAESAEFDAIICDLRMPRLGGREFHHRLISKNPAMAERVIFSTGDTVRGDTLAFLEATGRPWLNKPFSLAELRSALTQVGSRPAAPDGKA